MAISQINHHGLLNGVQLDIIWGDDSMSLEINKIHCGDCLELMRDIDDGSVDMVVTDPPYLIDYKTNYRKDKGHDFCSTILNDDNPGVIGKSLKECHRIMKDDSAIYMFCGPDKVDFFKVEIEKYFKLKNMIIWVKNNHTAGDLSAQFGKQYEIIFMANKGRANFYGRRLTDVWFFNRKVGAKQVHQNEKPVNLIEQCIQKHSQKGDLILDPFSGSGTTAVACKNTHRNFIGIELSPEYCEIANQRIKNAEPQLIFGEVTS